MISTLNKSIAIILLAFIGHQLFSQAITGKWLVYKGHDGSELVVTLTSKGGGQADFSLARREMAVSYGEGSQFWGTFRTTGGYYFIVKGLKSEKIRLSQTDSTLVITRCSEPTVKVTAWLDEDYSIRSCSDYGDYKMRIVAQWKRDFPNNENVKKQKSMMEHYLRDYYDDAFEFLLEGKYNIVERTETSIVLKDQEMGIPMMTWKKVL